MKIVIFLFAGFLFTSTYAQNCANNVCQLGGNFNQTSGYQCLEIGATVVCTCPGSEYEFGGPCRVCDAKRNPCNTGHPNYITCLDVPGCGAPFACLCQSPTGGNPIQTTNANCDISGALTCTDVTGPATPSPCLNSGVFDSANKVCHCPSGYEGQFCEMRIDSNLCNRVKCKNNGRCAIQRPNAVYEAVCLCPYGFSGDYCELTGTSGFCSQSLCLNGGACRENVIGSTRFAYCYCQPGFSGTKCENRYFPCTMAGLFRDENMHEQGKYFECKSTTNGLRAEQRSCPKGLRFDSTSKQCRMINN